MSKVRVRKKTDYYNNLAYSWQAEFRAGHIYREPALGDYKYVIWLDKDAVITKDWEIGRRILYKQRWIMI